MLKKSLLSLAIAGLTALPVPVLADNITDRAAELSAVDAKLTTGTRFERIAALESIIESRDLTRVQLAIKTALQSDDVELRAVALRGYFVFNDRFAVTRTVPDSARERVNQLVNQMKFENDPGAKVAPFADKYRVSSIELKQYEFKTGKGSANTADFETGFLPFVINAENVTFRIGGRITGNDSPRSDCFYDLRLAEGNILRGSVNCGPETPSGAVAEIRLY